MSKPARTDEGSNTTKITFHRWDGTWVPTFKKDGTFDGWKWVACADKGSANGK